MDKLHDCQADAVILDLEDSVPVVSKAQARDIVREKIGPLAAQGERVYVRINRGRHMHDLEDILACVQTGLEGLVLPMVHGPEDIDIVSALISEAEDRVGLAQGAIGLIPALETPRSLQHAYEFATRDRVTALIGASAKNADLSRMLGFRWSAAGLESLYFKSRTVLAARAANKFPIGGCWQDVHDLEGLRTYTEASRDLGFGGDVILHPSNAPVLNEVFVPSASEIAYYRGLVDAVEQGVAEGRASVIYKGEHVDYAHAATARAALELADSFGGQAG
jgi:citrate lyase subunit beta/citryl-CoA lyase